MNEPLKLGDFAELGRMIKYIDRHDDEEIRAVVKIEGEKESEIAEKNLKLADELIELTTGETNEENSVKTEENHEEV